MSVVAAIREMLARGLTVDQALIAAEAFEPKDDRTSRQKINARYYEERKGRLKTSEIKTSETSEIKTIEIVSDDLVPQVSPPIDNITLTLSSSPSVSVVEREREIERQVKADRMASDFVRFWNAYPSHEDKKNSAKAFLKVASEVEAILEGVERYKRDKPADRQWMHPSTFLNGRRWEDRPAQNSGAQNGQDRRGNSVSFAAANLFDPEEPRSSGGGFQASEPYVRLLSSR